MFRDRAGRDAALTMCLPNVRIQSAFFDDANDRFFVTQQKNGGYPTQTFSFVRWDRHTDAVADYKPGDGTMTLLDFGHGENFGVTTEKGQTWLWLECCAEGHGHADRKPPSRICRFPWTGKGSWRSNAAGDGESILSLPGAQIFNLQPNAEALSCTVDPVAGRLALRFQWTDTHSAPRGKAGYAGSPLGFQYAIYDLRKLSDDSVPIFPLLKEPEPPTVAGYSKAPNQGFALMGNFLYIVAGNGVPRATCVNDSSGGNDFITAMDVRSGACIYTHLGRYENLNIREPEGIWIQRAPSGPRLMFCLTSGGPTACVPGGDPAGPKKYANFLYKAEVSTKPIAGCSLV